MKVVDFDSIPAEPVGMEGAVGCKMRMLIGPGDGAPTFAMRQFDVAPNGKTPRHSHGFEHEVFVLAGEGIVLDSKGEHPLRPGVVVYIAPDEIHEFRNTGAESLKFICLIPNVLQGMNAPLAVACACS